MTRRILGMAAVLATMIAGGGAIAQADTIRVQSTTDTVDAGLFDGLIKPGYLAAQPGDTLNYNAVGTGKALDNARAGLADVVITHAPSLEATFVSQGYSYEPVGRQIFFSDYVIAGPASDPAHVLANHPHDAIGAFEDIAAAGASGTADFVSRGDNSGTDVQEEIMWGLTTTVQKRIACNAGTDTTRYEPGTGTGTCLTDIPTWYHRTGVGQAPNVQQAEACTAATFTSGACYVMTDRGTYNNLVNKGLVTHLKILSQNNTPDARGGQNLLTNPFSAYIVNPAGSFPAGSPVPNVAAATRFVDYLTSAGFQAAVDSFPTTTNPAFHADAYPKVTVSPALPATALTGTPITIHVTLTNKLPGATAISGMPTQLQQSTDGGTTFTNVGGLLNTNATGEVTMAPTLSATTTYRLGMARLGMLSPNIQTLGVVTAVSPTSPPPPPPPPGDHTAPRVTKVVLAAKKISMTVSEPATVKATIARRTRHHVKRKGKRVTTFTFATVKNLTIVATKAGAVSKTWKLKLSGGDYRVKLRATDHSGNVSNRTVNAHIKT